MATRPLPLVVGMDYRTGEIRRQRLTRATEVSAGYGNMLTASVVSCFPPSWRDPVGQLAASGGGTTPEPPNISVMGPGEFASDYAVEVSRRLLAREHRDYPNSVDALIYCHSSVDEVMDDTATTRICAALDLTDPLCFSVSQAHNCNVFAALWIAQSLLHTQESATVLIAAADKWLYPYLRNDGALGTYGDGAGALLLSYRVNSTGLRLLHVEPGGARAMSAVRNSDMTSLARESARVLEVALETAGIATASVDVVAHPSLDKQLCVEVAALAGLSDARQLFGLDAGVGHLSSADPIACLTRARARADLSKASIWITWGAGIHGEIGCAVLERSVGQ
jgi:3-oxoacyl-[acyl-carrier-protein] synthase III